MVRRIVDLNLTGALLVARRAVRDWPTAASVVNVTSAAATLGSPREYVQYAAAKAGVDALTLGLAQEVAAARIRVVGVAPGLVRTRIHEDAGDAGRLERVAAAVPLGRAGEPDGGRRRDRLADGRRRAYVTGATLRVAGGR